MSAHTLSSKFGWTLAAAAASLGCSVLYDLSPDQCGADSECVSRFGSKYECNAGLCERRAPSDDGSDDEGKAEGGSGCTSHAQCIEAFGDLDPRACVEGTCIPLKTDECPLLLPMRDDGWMHNLKTSDALILGAYSPVPDTTLVSHFTRFFDFAVEQLSQTVQGIPGPGGDRRQVVMVVCDGLTPSPEALLSSATHLIDDLKVPGLVSTLQSGDLQYLFEKKAKQAGTFILSGLDADDTILNLEDNGLVWTMLTGADQVAATYAPLLTRTIDFLRGRGAALGADDDVRVALIVPTGEPRLLQSIGDAITASIEFNGKSAQKNFPDNFRSFDIETVYGNAAASRDQSDLVKALLDYQPHVVMAMAAGEFLSAVVPVLESQWEETLDQSPPFYILSPYHLGNPDMGAALQGRASVARRMVGVNYAAAADSSVYVDYQIEFMSKYGDEIGIDDQSWLGYENLYDAPYYLLYAAAGAGRPPRLTGSGLAQGMTRLISGKTTFNIGSDDMSSVLGVLAVPGATLTLNGALGPANFDAATGARSDVGSVWCIDQLGNFHPDILRWNAEDEEFVDADPDIGQECIFEF